MYVVVNIALNIVLVFEQRHEHSPEYSLKHSPKQSVGNHLEYDKVPGRPKRPDADDVGVHVGAAVVQQEGDAQNVAGWRGGGGKEGRTCFGFTPPLLQSTTVDQPEVVELERSPDLVRNLVQADVPSAATFPDVVPGPDLRHPQVGQLPRESRQPPADPAAGGGGDDEEDGPVRVVEGGALQGAHGDVAVDGPAAAAAAAELQEEDGAC